MAQVLKEILDEALHGLFGPRRKSTASSSENGAGITADVKDGKDLKLLRFDPIENAVWEAFEIYAADIGTSDSEQKRAAS
jgi:hypothetical protein